MRRILLVLLTAIIVLRPLVRGEDPGQLSDFADTGSMALTLFALVGCAAWSAWRLWTREPAIYIGPVEISLFVLVILLGISSNFAPYHRAALLTTWEWMGLALTVFLIRQLAVRPEEQRGLLAVFLAGAVSLSAQGVYQAVYELPSAARAAKGDAEQYLKEQLDLQHRTATKSQMEELVQRLQRRQVHGPYFHPSSLAASLALMLPMLVGAFIAARRGDTPGWLRVMTAFFAALAFLVLCLTRCWSAVFAVGLVGLGILALRWPPQRGGLKVGLAVALVVAGLVGYGLVATGLLSPEIQRWREAWFPTWRLIESRVSPGASSHWLKALAAICFGVGPAQFGFFYPRYMTPTDGLPLTSPPSGLLELWAEGGLLALLVFVFAIVWFFRTVVRWWRESQPAEHPAASPEVATPGATAVSAVRNSHQPESSSTADTAVALTTPVHWEYYLGGMIGMILAFLLRAGSLPGDDVIGEAITAGLRSIFWFAAVGVFEGIAWDRAERVGALSAGIAALLLVLLVNPGIDYPSVVGLLWIAVALVLATIAPRPVTWLTPQVAYVLPVPLLVGVAFSYFAFFFYPASVSLSVERRARLAETHFLVDRNKSPQERKILNPKGFILANIIEPLQQADSEDNDNVRLRVMLAGWYEQVWEIDPADTAPQSNARQAARWAKRAREANPEGPDGYMAAFDLHWRIARMLDESSRQLSKSADDPKLKIDVKRRENNRRTAALRKIGARQQYKFAGDALRAYIRRDPSDPELHFHLADALHQAGEVQASREEARIALDLDDEETAPRRKLTDKQREQAETYSKADSAR